MHRFIPNSIALRGGVGSFNDPFYAINILLGVMAAAAIGRRRYANAGGDIDVITDVSIVAIPAGIIGGRVYHVVTSPDAYFGAHGHPLNAVKIWDGGMGIREPLDWAPLPPSSHFDD
jgi:prolipoprotein diacylglyceryltransferase